MRAMAHYGAYVVDTSGGGTISFVTEDDRSFTSQGRVGRMSRFASRVSGCGVGYIAGVPIDISRLRVIDPCVPHGTCK